MTAIDTGLQDLKRQHPEWEPWLAVIQEILSEAANPKWDAVCSRPHGSAARQGSAPRRSHLGSGEEFSSPSVGTADPNRFIVAGLRKWPPWSQRYTQSWIF